MKIGAMILVAAAVGVLPGCTTSGTHGLIPPAPAAGKCSPDGLNAFIGQKATAEVGAQMLGVTGAHTLRWVPPRTAVTMDYREDRLTVSYDDNMVITQANCG